MGHSSKKKKKKGGGGRKAAKDHSAQIEGNQAALSEELTALAAIYQEDFKVTSESPHTQFKINLRPHSDGMCFGDLNVSAILDVRCSPGYPHKCPKLRIVPEKCLSKEDADRLLSLLVDQANIYSREGRVMIFDLVEAAQEFLSEIVPPSDPPNHAQQLGSSTTQHSSDVDMAVRLDNGSYPGFSYIYSSFDLYSQLYDDNTSWGVHVPNVANDVARENVGSQTEPNDRSKTKSILEKTHVSADMENFVAKSSPQDMAEQLRVAKYGAISEAVTKLNVVAEQTENDSETVSTSDGGNMLDTPEKSFSSSQHQLEDTNHGKQAWNDDDCNAGCGSSDGSSYVSNAFDIALRNKKKDLILVHLLRLACASKESLFIALPVISSELCNLGVLSEWAKDLISAPSSGFGEAFSHAFGQQMISSECALFWKADSGDDSSSRPNSRYLNDFEELRSLGHGGFGHVALCKNKLDGRQYAVKRIRLKDRSPQVNEKILREVATLSRLQHQHVVRYYQAWVETEYGYYHVPNAGGSRTAESSTHSYEDISLSDAGGGNKQESTYLYIQMEYCPRTLRQDFETYSSSFDIDHVWHLFRQIVEGLAHIHSQGIIHRDLTPSNIFFDVRNDIKIGDFGLAKFLKLEQLDHDQYLPTEATGVSMDGTGLVGTYFYTAPEVEQKWPQINEKVDMYSLGVIFFELWHPFATAMERHLVLSDLKQKGDPPASWTTKFPSQSNLLRRLLSSSPSDRPSAIELLQNELPPRMEDEWLNDVLRMLQTPEDTYVYDRVISTIFNEDRMITKSHCQHDDSKKTTSNNHNSELLDSIIEVSKEVFKQHCAKKFQISPLHILDSKIPGNRKTVKLLTQGGDMLELCYELRTPFVMSIASKQISSFKRYEISWVHRRAVGHSTPYRFLQGDFDIVGGASPIAETEVIKVAMDIGTHFFHSNAIVVRLNHGQLAESVCSWAGVPSEQRQNVAELLSSTIIPHCPNSADRKSKWKDLRKQLFQGLRLSEAVFEKLRKADIRFCGSADKALARLRGTLSYDKSACKALDDLSALINYLRVWSVEEQHITLDVLMPPSEPYYRELFFQVYWKESNLGSNSEEKLLAIGGRYDRLVEQMWDKANKSNRPGAVGISIALEKILGHFSSDIRLPRIEPSISVLVCSKGGGGLLKERMELVAELWQANIKAEFVPQLDPSLQEQYEYASDHDIRCLIFITEAGLAQTDLVKVRHLDAKKEKEVKREEIIKFISDAISAQFKNPTIWS